MASPGSSRPINSGLVCSRPSFGKDLGLGSADVLCFPVAMDLAFAFAVIVIVGLEALPLDKLPLLSHEKLDVYQKSIQLVTLSMQVLASTPRGYAELCDQLKRAALSVPLNIAEASGRTGSLDNAKHFSIARGSALECGAIFDVFNALQLVEPKLYREAKILIIAEVSMLSKLCMKRL